MDKEKVILDLDKYDELMTYKSLKESYKKIVDECELTLEKYEKDMIDRIIEYDEYNVKEIKNINITDYHYQEIAKRYFNIGIDDLNYINAQIKKVKECYENEKNEEGDKE